MKKMFPIIGCVLVVALTGCTKDVSGRFEGKYVQQHSNTPMNIEIKSNGDLYDVHIEHYNDFITEGGVTRDFKAQEIDEYTAKVTGGGCDIRLSKDGNELFYCGARAPLLKKK